MPLSIVSSDISFPLNSVKLGRLVKSVEFPTHNFHDPHYPDAPKEEPIVRGQYARVLQGENSAGFTAKLTSLISSGFSKRANTTIRIKTSAAKTYTLDNSAA
ncbi:hypothetical protein L13192_07591 [Pyrenophora tritici-repentis]|nr:hypothetical protein L13192_07591 [Pyrenophora tritici-repentis]KAI1680789.1 hypothetical protein KJE20_09640 [Pyrenophora tritici-repentis]